MKDEDVTAAQGLVERLDRLVPRDEAWMRLEEQGGDPTEWWLTGNQHGYYRMGVEFLKASLQQAAPAEAGHGHLPLDLDYLAPPGCNATFVACVRNEGRAAATRSRVGPRRSRWRR